MNYAFPPAPQPHIVIANSNDRFPVRRIYCVGQNYLAHVLEMGSDPSKPPFFFTKPADAVVADGSDVAYASETENLHYEAELVVAIGTGGANITETDALNHVWGYATGIDLTRRDLQTAAKNAGKPWDMAKGFDNSAPCGALHPVAEVGHVDSGHIRLSVNGEMRQDSDLSDMIWSVPAIIATLSRFVTLAPGDLIYTGTPSGVGPVVAGDRLKVEIEGLSDLTVSIT
ncbi:MAG: fumarylacetoacetate hydrolase family protein [Paracoccaceae bacterium]